MGKPRIRVKGVDEASEQMKIETYPIRQNLEIQKRSRARWISRPSLVHRPSLRIRFLVGQRVGFEEFPVCVRAQTV